ncbi:putative atpase aaa-type core [Diplodia seriata]|nr:putative atpase aaa-type core [Diplodia seriata]
MLCFSHVYAYALQDRLWDLLDVEGLKAPRIDRDVINTLVMRPESNKAMVKAICETYGQKQERENLFFADFIRGKGEGQVMLLHGPPGTGKTLTAESIAEYTQRPLLSITAADLGHEPDLLEKNLLRFFRNATKWDAIVLLDEADVFLERRSANDLRRNSIVSVFLRALDYFQGILFLTTNRVGSFDEAFMSRIHLQIGYAPLDDSARLQVWNNSFKKLSANHKQGGKEIQYSFSAKEYVKSSKTLHSLRWNGREIRNAFQTAVALASFEAKQSGEQIPTVTEDHISQVVDMSSTFKDYMKSALQANDADIAYRDRLRNDRFKLVPMSDGTV